MADTLFDLAQRATPLLVLVAVVIYVMLQPEKAEKMGGWLLGLLSFGNKKLRQRSIKSSIQGNISDFARSMNGQVKGIMPYNVRLQFVKEVDRAELKPDDQTVIVRVRDTLNDDKNLVNSMLTFCSIGVLPQARQFLSESMNAAINVTMTRKMLNGLKHYSALQYLHGVSSVDGSVVADSASINMARRVAQTVKSRKLGDVGRTMEYNVPGDSGKERKQILIEINLV